jgi:site-specific recombinase XerD
MKEYVSCFAPLIEPFAAYRKASESWSRSYRDTMRQFDNYCRKAYPDAVTPAQKMIDDWCKQHDNESNNSCITRCYAIVSMIKYWQTRYMTTLNPPELPRHERSAYISHAFTDEELSNFFKACDNMPSSPAPSMRARKIIIPVLFRLLYSSGIRTTEARLLRVSNVDLEHGVLNIQHSKGLNQHYVALHDSMTELLSRYDAEIRKIIPERTFFFPNRNGQGLTQNWVQTYFKHCWEQGNTAYAVSYQLRHHYATSNINSWVDEGFGFDAKLLSLSKSMGHSVIESTKYYYALVPELGDILEEKTNTEFEDIVPEVDYEEIYE